MATKSIAAPAPAPASDAVWLACEALGKTEPFAPAHAKALLQLQADRGLSDWKETAAPAASTAAE